MTRTSACPRNGATNQKRGSRPRKCGGPLTPKSPSTPEPLRAARKHCGASPVSPARPARRGAAQGRRLDLLTQRAATRPVAAMARPRRKCPAIDQARTETDPARLETQTAVAVRTPELHIVIETRLSMSAQGCEARSSPWTTELVTKVTAPVLLPGGEPSSPRLDTYRYPVLPSDLNARGDSLRAVSRLSTTCKNSFGCQSRCSPARHSASTCRALTASSLGTASAADAAIRKMT